MVSSDYHIADNSDMENKKLEAARNHYMNGDYQSALNLYLSLVNANISYKLYHRIAKCYYKMGDMKNAEENFRRSVNLEKGENPSYMYLGNIAYKNEDIRNAIYYREGTNEKISVKAHPQDLVPYHKNNGVET